MNKYAWKHFVGCLALALLASCGGQKEEHNEKEGVETVLPSQPNEVTVMTLTPRTFNHELVSNGKVTAREHADLYFRTAEVVGKVYVKNGERVRKGQKLAELDLFRLDNTLQQRKNALQQATLDMQDVLIGQGYAPDNLEAVPTEILQLAKVKSGYESAKAQYEAAQYDVQQATLTAPFDGVVANLFDKAYNMAKTGEPFCRVIATGNMEADFTVLESELPLIKTGDKVEVTPYASTVGACTGNISEINPIVDENGMVRVKARVDGAGRLFDGMNVRVSVKRAIDGQMVVPKTAVVLRSGKQVMFTLKDGKAMWNYVQTGLENMTEYTLVNWAESGLEEGMEVITTGNVNLAHEAPVKVIE
ncbi:MAG: efflux RND transporter periplasmic adaptor subunit [Bacteroides sp.]|nr:efflux RND transporter periplasmic adaptor subunit [Bacteroides sp.]